MILVTGATGQIGGAIVAALPGVRALVRRPSDLPGAVVGDFDDERSLALAMEGVETLFLAGRDNPDAVARHFRVLDAALAAGVRHVVKLSAIAARADNPVALFRWHHAVDERLRASDFAWTFLQPHLFMQNLLRFAGEATLAAPMGEGRYPLVDTRDVGEAAAAVLRDPAAHAGRTYALTGPAALSYDEVAATLGLPYEAVAPEAFKAARIAAGTPAWRAEDLADIASAYRADENVVTDDLPALLGRPATSLERFVSDCWPR